MDEKRKKKHRRQNNRDDDDDDDDNNNDNDTPERADRNRNRSQRRQDQQQDDKDDYDFTKSAHPISLFFHAIFKIGAILSYFFLGLIFSDIIQDIAIILFNCFDFWTVKNVTGRKLVGMRWWSDFKEDGEEEWCFESYDREIISNKVDKNLFWTLQTGYTLFWLAFAIINVISLSPTKLVLDIVGLILSGTNLYGYYKCSKEHQKKLSGLSQKLMFQGAMYAMGR